MMLEFRTPLTAIVGWSELILNGKIGSLSEKQHRGLTSIHNSGKYLLEILSHLLEVNRLVHGNLHLYFKEVDLNQLIEQLILANQVQLQQNVPGHLPNISADRERIRQTLIWMLAETSQAVRWGEEGTITLTANSNNNWVIFSITAVGREKLYYYDDPDDPIYFFSRSIIEMHGGQMQVKVQEELKKLEISFTLPIEQNKPTDRDPV